MLWQDAATPLWRFVRLLRDSSTLATLVSLLPSAMVAGFLAAIGIASASAGRVPVSGCIVTLLCLGFAFGRAAFIISHRLAARAEVVRSTGVGDAERAFARALAERGLPLVKVAVGAVVAAALCDLALASVGAGARHVLAAVLLAAFVAWLFSGRALLIACGLWAVEGVPSLPRAYLFARRRGQRAWIAIAALTVLAPVLVTLGLKHFRVATAAVLLDDPVSLLVAGALLGLAIGVELWIQGVFAAWLVSESLEEEEDLGYGSAGRPNAALGRSWSPWPASSILSAIQDARPRRKRSGSPAPITRGDVRLSDALGLAMILLAGASLAGLHHDARTAIPVVAEVVTLEPLCNIRKPADGRPERRTVPCRDVDKVLAAEPGFSLEGPAGATVVASYHDPAGTGRAFTGFVPDGVAATAGKTGQIRLDYHEGWREPARARPDGMDRSIVLLLLLGLAGGVVMALPHIRHRLLGVPYALEPHGQSGAGSQQKPLRASSRHGAAMLAGAVVAILGLIFASSFWDRSSLVTLIVESGGWRAILWLATLVGWLILWLTYPAIAAMTSVVMALALIVSRAWRARPH